MSVSRVEYDAALKRVNDERECESPCGGQYAKASLCECIAVTLAALGLDEPPTEATSDATLIADCLRRHGVSPGRNPDGINDDVAKLVTLVDGLAASNRVLFDQCREAVVPPAEPPKACPTCEGYGGQPGLRGVDRLLRPPCAACNGTGIDGGT